MSEIPLEKLAEVLRHTQPVGAAVQRQCDQDPAPARLRGRDNEQLLLAQELAQHDVVGPKIGRPRRTLLRRTSRAGGRSQKGQPPLPILDVLEESGLPTCHPQIERVARQPVTVPGVLDLVSPGRPVQRRHQLERVARAAFRRRWPASEPGERIRESRHRSWLHTWSHASPTGCPAAAPPQECAMRSGRHGLHRVMGADTHAGVCVCLICPRLILTYLSRQLRTIRCRSTSSAWATSAPRSSSRSAWTARANAVGCATITAPARSLRWPPLLRCVGAFESTATARPSRGTWP